jgi:hypothetical protein
MVAQAHAEDAPDTVPNRQMTFDHYSPLASGYELLDRVIRPLLAERLLADVAAKGTRIAEQSIDLAQEHFALYVPKSPAPPAGYGLMVFVPPWQQAAIPARWLSVFDRHGMIVVAAAQSGNPENVVSRRIPLALTGYENVKQRYALNPEHVYIGGFSGGSRVAMRTALAYPDVFRGAFLNSGSDAIGTAEVPLPKADLFRQFEEHSRLVYVTGSEDTDPLARDRQSRESAGPLCISESVTFTMTHKGHEPADSWNLERVLTTLEQPRSPDSKLEQCRARRTQEMTQQVAEVEHLIDAGKLSEAVRKLDQVDQHFGGLALPSTLDIARRLRAKGAWPMGKAGE